MTDTRDWVDHFEDNDAVHAATDATIDFAADPTLDPAARSALIASVQRFALGESGDGAHLLRKAAEAGDPAYARAVELFVAEEQQHAELLLRLLDHLGGTPIRAHWSDTVFVGLRRMMGLRTELMVLMVAEVVALSYYGALAERAPDATTAAVARRILADEVAHVQFHTMRLRTGFAAASAPVRLLARAAWFAAAFGATTVVAFDHRAALGVLGYHPTVFVRDILRDFAAVVRAVLEVSDPSAQSIR